MGNNRFSAMAKNMESIIDENEADQIDKQKEAANNSETFQKVPEKLNKPEIETEQSLQAKKTIHLPLILDLAIKELKDRRNIVKQVRREKGRSTDEAIVIEALEFFFKQKGNNQDAFKTAGEKLKNYQ